MIRISSVSNDIVTPIAKIEAPKLGRIHIQLKPEVIQHDSFPKREKKEYAKEELEALVKDISRVLFEEQDTHFRFEIHEGTGRMMVNLVDTRTSEVLKEMPPEKILDLVANIWETVGLLVDERG